MCEWKELVLCSPSICFRPIKPSCRQNRRIIKGFWSGKGRTPSNCLRDCTSRDRRHITSRKDSKPLALVCVVMPGMFCQDTPFICFAAWTNCQECRGILWYSRHVRYILHTRTSACFAPFPHAQRLNSWLVSEKKYYFCLPAHPEDFGAEP